MDMPPNPLKRALREGRPQIGLWCSIPSHITIEIVAGSGFDWLTLDTEHAPNDVPTVLTQLHALAESGVPAVVRPAWNDPVLFKRFMDIGVLNFVVPWVQNAEEARRAVAATRYAPHGIRGVAAAVRANRYGRVKDYLARVHEEVCLIVQLETRAALDNLESIAAVDGVDALFIGPSDLAADLGHLGDNAHPEVRATIEDAIARIRRAGKAPGILAVVEADARYWFERGALFVGVGSDIGLLARHTEALVARTREVLAGLPKRASEPV
jgi:4-hydroxy-2-oxoheptanedioate aldolase